MVCLIHRITYNTTIPKVDHNSHQPTTPHLTNKVGKQFREMDFKYLCFFSIGHFSLRSRVAWPEEKFILFENAGARMLQQVETYQFDIQIARLTSTAMNNWKQVMWHSCFNRWARLRPVVQAVGLAAKSERTEEMDLWHLRNLRVSDSSAGWANALVMNQGGALETLTQKETCCIDIHWLYASKHDMELKSVKWRTCTNPNGESSESLEPDQLCCNQHFLHRISRNQVWQLDYPLWKRWCQDVAASWNVPIRHPNRKADKYCNEQLEASDVALLF